MKNMDLPLTQAEQHLLDALPAGATNKQLAASLGKSEFTVRNQLSNLFRKMGVSNRTQAAAWHTVQNERRGTQGQPFGTSVPLRALAKPTRI